MKNLKQRLLNGETLNGCWLNLGSAVTSEIVGLSGFDWVLIDLEHGAGSESTTLSQIQALEHTNAGVIVRAESTEPQRIHRVLDMGAEGVMCPKVKNADEALKVIKGLHYPPHGNRGVAKMVRATQFGLNFNDYYQKSRDQILGIVQIETKEVLNHLNEVAAAVGILFFNPDDYQKYHNMGIRFLACGADATFVADGARNLAKKLNDFRKQQI